MSLPAVGYGDEPFNIAAFLPAQARLRPYQKVVIFPEGRTPDGQRCYSHMTYAQLERHSNRVARALVAGGIERGMRTLLMVRPGPTFISLTFALFKLGAVPILIDPGMGKANLLDSIAAVKPEGMVAISLAHAARCRYRSYFRTLRKTVTVGRRWFWGGPTLDGLLAGVSDETFDIAPTVGRDPAAILYTSGSTGPPKGVAYEHQMFGAQVEAIRTHYGIEEGEVDLPCLPLFVLFSVALGVTSVIPDMDPTRPAHCDPALLVEAIEDHGVTYSFGSPAIWNRVGPYCVKHGITLASLRRVLIAGAPVPERVVRPMLESMGPDADVHTPYGATESLPIASWGGRAAIAETFAKTDTGAGVCVGAALPGAQLQIIRPVDGPVARWDEVELLPAGEIGEICVKGTVVTREYAFDEAATSKSKIADGEGWWHRIGDVGYLDEQARLWFCGRVAHRVHAEHGVMYTVPCEAIYNTHASVFRSALVGVGPRPVICIETEPGVAQTSALRDELLTLGKRHEHTAPIADLLFHPSFPVDIRHNAKIFREKLAVWAAEQL